MSGVFKAYPLINSHGDCLWPEKFLDEESLEKLRGEVISKQAWEREYLLKIIPDDEQIIDAIWIRTYHTIPSDMKRLGIFVGVDLAISEKLRQIILQWFQLWRVLKTVNYTSTSCLKLCMLV